MQTAELRRGVPRLLDSLSGPEGFYRYSLSGDLAGPEAGWGLGNTVFAVKTMAALGTLGSLSWERRGELGRFIASFRTADGRVFDRWVHRRSSLRNKLNCLRHRDFANFFNSQVRRAETRQAVQALRLLGLPSPAPLREGAGDDVEQQLARLDWRRPWSAGSHASHLLFFLALRRDAGEPAAEARGRRVLAWLSDFQRPDGGWYRGAPSAAERAFGAMKVLTGLRAWGPVPVPRPERLVDLALAARGGDDACSWLNATYLLRHAAAEAPAHRASEAHAFAEDALARLAPHYHEGAGGFSFYPGRANTHYYGARVSRGLPEPDIHGTMLLTWGLSLLEPLLGRSWGLTEVDP
ncbi:MAG: hypothetical protein HYZ75_10735 [Elusimicrobia bacterium]|nr:hypothetical protein [Elusimicrobiota bacterium]